MDRRTAEMRRETSTSSRNTGASPQTSRRIAVALVAAGTLGLTVGSPEAVESSPAPDTWRGTQWSIRGENVERRGGRIVATDVRARLASAASDPAWELRADRLVGWVRTPGRLGALRASGRVRLIGPPPYYASASHAISFRPGRSIALLGRTEPPALATETWRIPGRRVVVDFRRPAASIRDAGAASTTRPSQGSS